MAPSTGQSVRDQKSVFAIVCLMSSHSWQSQIWYHISYMYISIYSRVCQRSEVYVCHCMPNGFPQLTITVMVSYIIHVWLHLQESLPRDQKSVFAIVCLMSPHSWQSQIWYHISYMYGSIYRRVCRRSEVCVYHCMLNEFPQLTMTDVVSYIIHVHLHLQ